MIYYNLQRAVPAPSHRGSQDVSVHKADAFPKEFLWGAATGAHQVEGNNTNSDNWVLEHVPGTPYVEPSGDACDHYRLYGQDIQTLAQLGFNSYRFSIEWARVEPEEGEISKAALRHYADMLAACHEQGLTPLVTLHHFSNPRWLMKRGGWESSQTPERFAAYCRAVMQELGSLIPFVCTLNETNIASVLRLLGIGEASDDADTMGAAKTQGIQAPIGMVSERDTKEGGTSWLEAAAREMNTTADRLKTFVLSTSEKALEVKLEAHRRAVETVKSTSPDAQVGINDQTVPGGEREAERIKEQLVDRYLSSTTLDDFIGVQNYSRLLIGAEGILPYEEGVEMTQAGYEFYPEALAGAVRLVVDACGKPVIVTENGLAGEDDSRRVEFIKRALTGLHHCLDDGIDVRGYYYWSALDNWEWMLGYGCKFGLIAVNRETQARQVKESARYLGQVARSNGTDLM